MKERVCPRLLVLGNIGSGKSTFARALGSALGWSHHGIDDARRDHGDGSPAGEARAWAAFLEHAESGPTVLLECTGAGPFMDLLRLALHRSGQAWAVLLVNTPTEECLRRVESRGLDVPYPDFGVPLSKVIPHVARILEEVLETSWPSPLSRMDGMGQVDEQVTRAAQAVSQWLTEEMSLTRFR